MRLNGILKFLLCTLIPFSALYAQSPNPIDLTYSFNHKAIYWPTETGFRLEKLFSGFTSKGYFYSAYRYCAPEHGGTHIDAPRHFYQYGHTVEEIPVTQLIGNAVVIHVERKVENDRDYAIQVADIKKFERQYRPLNTQDIVLFYTGWGQYWENRKQYLGTDKLGDISHLHFPGLSKEAAKYLVKKAVKGVGLDTPSLDPGVSVDFKAHQIILGANLFGVENVANLSLVPPVGAKLIVAPMKIEGGSGAPTRVFALTS